MRAMRKHLGFLLLGLTLGVAGAAARVANCNQLFANTPKPAEVTVSANCLPNPLYTGSEIATLDLRLKTALLHSIAPSTGAVGTVKRQFAYKNSNGQTGYLIEIRLADKLKAGAYPVPLTITWRDGYSSTIHPVIKLLERPRVSPPVITADYGKRSLAAILPQPLVDGNRFTVLDDGPTAFNVWLKTIASARKQINIQTYFLEGDGLSSLIVAALKRKAQSGVEVNLLLCRYSQLGKAPIIPLALRTDGINVVMAGDLGFPKEDGNQSLGWIRKMHADYRVYSAIPKESSLFEWTRDRDEASIDFALHEKMLIADGRTAIVGGRNISDSYFWWWRDLDLLVAGPLVRDIQDNFKENWRELNGKPIKSPEVGEDYAPLPGGKPAQLVCSSPWLGQHYNIDMLCGAIGLARDHVYLTSQYLALPPKLNEALIMAAKRGVDVRIITNSHETGQEVARGLCHYVSLNYYRELLSHGVKIYEYYGPLNRQRFRPYYHAKQFTVDGRWLAVGSFNLSIRSSYIESELLVAINDAELAQQREKVLLEQMHNEARQVQLADLTIEENRSARLMHLAKRIEILY